MTQRYELHITATGSGISAIDLLAANAPLSKQRLKTAMSHGAVWLESRHGIKRIRRTKKPLKHGDTLHLYYDSEVLSQTTQAARLIADEGDYSIWDKPSGMYSQGSKWGDHCTIYRFAERQLQPERPAFLVHRLDRAASGLIILAHNKHTANAFAQMFRRHAITKHYRAMVEGDPGNIDLPCSIVHPLDGKKAETLILSADHDAATQSTTLLIEIKSGRKHQIRRHLSSIGHPIIGDRLYGAADTRMDLQLRSIHLSFVCPVKKTLREYTL